MAGAAFQKNRTNGHATPVTTNGESKRYRLALLHITRVADGKWCAEVPVFAKDEWDGYLWRVFTDIKRIMDVIRMFFEEMGWFGMIDFKMDRHGDYA